MDGGGVLRYVHPDLPVAYFCEPDASGDDWNDRPWEHNAEPPYRWITRVVYLDTNLDKPNEGTINSPWSVDDINAGAVAWLSDRYAYDALYIPAGVTVAEFHRLIERAGGTAVVVPEPRRVTDRMHSSSESPSSFSSENSESTLALDSGSTNP